MKKNNVKKNYFDNFGIGRLFLSIFLSIMTIITFLFCESAKIKKDVLIKVNEKTYFESISVSGNTYEMDMLLEMDNDKYYSDKDISFTITNNDSLKIIANSNFELLINNKKQTLVSDENGFISFEMSTDKYRIITGILNDFNKIILFLILSVFIIIYYVLVKIIQSFFEKLFSNNKIDLKYYLLTMTSFFVIFYFNFRTFINIFYFYSGIFIVLVLFYFIIKYKNSKNFNYQNIYLIIAIIIGFSIMFINPPFNVLDEGNHYSKVNDQFIFKNNLKFDEDGKFYSYQSLEISSFIKKYEEYEISYDDKNSIMSSYEEYVTYESDNNVVVSYGTSLANQLAYIPAMIGVHAAKYFNANIYLMFMLGRFMNFVIFVLLCYYGIKIIPKFKYLLFVICTFSILIQQGIGVNQDWLNNGCLILLFSYIFYLIFEKEKVEEKDYLFLIMLSIGLAFSKTIYTVFTLLILFVPNKKIISNEKNKVFCKALIIKCLVVLCAALLTILSYKFNDIFLDIPVNKAHVSHLYSWFDFFANPLWGLSMIVKSVAKSCHLYFFLSYFKDFGWYKVSFPHIITLLIAIIYLFIIFIQPKERFDSLKKEWLFKIGNVFVFCIIIFLVACSMFFGWTQKGADYIDGMQGRYFLPAIFSAYLLLNNSWFKISKAKLLNIVTFLICVINLYSVIYMIYGFYF